MSNNSITGYLFLFSGSLDTNLNIIEICNQKDQQDYYHITEFITNLD